MAMLKTWFVGVAFAALTLCLAGGAQAIVLDDGTAHTIPGTDADIIVTTGGVGVEVGPTNGATTLELGTGGTISVDTTGGASGSTIGVQVKTTSTFTYSGGTLSVHNTSNNKEAIGVQAFGTSTVNITGNNSFEVRDTAAGASGSNSTAIEVPDGESPTINISGTIDLVSETNQGSIFGIRLNNNSDATLTVTSTGSIASITETAQGNAFGIWAGGTNNASTVDFAGALTITNEATGSGNSNRDAYGILAGGNSDFDVSGTINVTESGLGFGYGIAARDNAVVDISGTVDLDENGGHSGIGLLLEGSSVATIAGTGDVRVDEGGDGAGNGAQLLDNSTLWILPGGKLTVLEAGSQNNHNSGLLVNGDNATATLAGELTVTETQNGFAHLARILNGTVDITGGTYSVTEGGGHSLRPFEVGDGTGAAGTAVLNISGGSFTFSQGGTGALQDSTILGDGAVTLFGDSDGFVVNGVAITSTTTLGSADVLGSDPAGRFGVTGTLLDGSPLATSLDFAVTGSGLLTLNVAVPEPSSLLLGLLGLLGLAWYGLRRRK